MGEHDAVGQVHRPTEVRHDPVEAALAAGVTAIAASMANARPEDVVVLADRMATLARELEARRGALAGVVDLTAEARRRGQR